MTCMGEGLSLALDLLEKRKAKYKATGVDYYQPVPRVFRVAESQRHKCDGLVAGG